MPISTCVIASCRRQLVSSVLVLGVFIATSATYINATEDPIIIHHKVNDEPNSAWTALSLENMETINFILKSVKMLEKYVINITLISIFGADRKSFIHGSYWRVKIEVSHDIATKGTLNAVRIRRETSNGCIDLACISSEYFENGNVPRHQLSSPTALTA